MPGNNQDNSLLELLNSQPSTSELLADLGHFAGLGAAGGGIPATPNEGSLVDPLAQPVVAGSAGGGTTIETLLQQLSTQTQVLNGVLGADTSGSGSNSLLHSLTGLLGGSGGGSFSGILGGIFGGLGLSPLISGLADLFGGGGSDTSPSLIPFQMPASVQFQGGIDGPGGGLTAVDYGQNGLPRSAGQASGSAAAAGPQITVQVNAMDSKSFLDHSDDIARAVRQAMLTSNSLNDVVAGI